MKGRRHRLVWRVVPRSSKQACAVPARQRLVWAVAGSLMLHGVGLAVLWRTLVPQSVLPTESQMQPPAMQWVALVPTPVPAPAAGVVPGETGEAAGARSAAPRAMRRATVAIVRPLPRGRVRQSTASPERETPVVAAAASASAPAPSLPASAAQPQAVLRPDVVALALARERAWQRRQGLGHAPQTWAGEVPATMGAEAVVRDLRGPGGSRTAKVSGPWGDYCVELPSADQPPTMGAAPRMVPARTCR
jgi:hypothetical protein